VERPTGNIHILGMLGKIKANKLAHEARRMTRNNSGLAALFEKCLQALVPECTDHDPVYSDRLQVSSCALEPDQFMAIEKMSDEVTSTGA
jgi:hypothetical protein